MDWVLPVAMIEGRRNRILICPVPANHQIQTLCLELWISMLPYLNQLLPLGRATPFSMLMCEASHTIAIHVSFSPSFCFQRALFMIDSMVRVTGWFI